MDNSFENNTNPLKPIMGIYRAPLEHKYLNYNERPELVIIDTIVILYSVSDFTTSYSSLTADRGVSSHYLIREDGRIDNLVQSDKRAWHSGKSNWLGKENVNDFSIGIMLVNTGSGEQTCYPVIKGVVDIILQQLGCGKNLFPETQLDALSDLILYLKSEFPSIEDRKIIGHADVTAYEARHIGPGAAFDWQYLANKGHGIYSNITIENPQILYKYEDKGPQIKDLQIKLSTYGYNIMINGEFDLHTANVVRAFNLHHNQNSVEWGGWDNNSDVRLDDILTQINLAGINETTIIDTHVDL